MGVFSFWDVFRHAASRARRVRLHPARREGEKTGKGEHCYSPGSHLADAESVQPGKGGFMINLRVDDLDAMVEEVKAKGADILGHVDEGYGTFAWLLDPDGIKIELWQQVERP